jgi:hypothetical protein
MGKKSGFEKSKKGRKLIGKSVQSFVRTDKKPLPGQQYFR